MNIPVIGDPPYNILTVILCLLGYTTLVAATFFVVNLIRPYDKQLRSDDSEGVAVALFLIYPIAAPVALISSIKARVDVRRSRRLIEQKRADELLEIEHKTRLKELQAADAEVTAYIERRD